MGQDNRETAITLIRSRAAKLAEVVPNAPKRCPACKRRVGTHFVAFYTGHPEVPETVRLVAWKCTRCDAMRHIVPPQRED